jgi:rSAM/selenodomain-associated transferase 2
MEDRSPPAGASGGPFAFSGLRGPDRAGSRRGRHGGRATVAGVRIAVVIPALQEAGRIEAAVRSASAPGVEVVVADGGSRDATRARAEAAGARVVVSEPGRARQLQAGARAAVHADALLFLHADTRLPDGYADQIRDALADPEVAGGAFAFRFDERTPGLRLVEWGVHVRTALAALPYGDQGIFVRRSVFDAIGGVPQVPIMEDVDLVRAVRRHGRLARLSAPAITSARRYREAGVARTVWRNTVAILARALGIDRARVASWYRG